ncbi:MAG TPA: THUMP domain-containing protein [Deltaproteobacteria bacterium]|nr:THUMP domain-containing protein [Deltaproteobacteria bacterium]HOI07049.1 THUMP domain-containing protein [Deltaproteobacteria bacterium]
MVFSYLRNNRYFAQVADGIEDLGAGELTSLGASDVKPTFRGVYFSADKPTLYRINYTSRLLTHVFAPLVSFDCHSTKYLYKTARTLPWPELMGLEETFMISSNVSHSKIRHSQYAALVLKDAIVDTFNERYGKRPDVERIHPDLVFNLHIFNNKATIYLDTSGGSLHRRGYRKEAVGAPMQETLAAAIVELSGWDGSTPLYDPMCGSGTLLCEALMRYCRIPSGYLRTSFGFEHLPDFDRAVWVRVKKGEDKAIRELPRGLVSGSDASGEAVSTARANASRLKGEDRVVLKKSRYQEIGGLQGHTIVCNPPYGIRMKGQDDMKTFIREFGDFLKQKCQGSTAFVYFGDRSLVKSVGLRSTWKKPLKNGPLDGRLVRYDLY